jgi:hypothetical protein
MSPETLLPGVGELLPRAAAVFGVRAKLATYSLDITNKVGGPKARGLERILGITIDAIDYLEAQILARVLDTPISCCVRTPAQVRAEGRRRHRSFGYSEPRGVRRSTTNRIDAVRFAMMLT